jgi:hypothetical protein
MLKRIGTFHVSIGTEQVDQQFGVEELTTF